jgi:hypothetical protein
MAGDGANRIGGDDGAEQRPERPVLRRRKGLVGQTFEFDADGKVVAIGAPLPAGDAGMPGARRGADELQQPAVAAQEEMRRNAEPGERGEFRVRRRIETVGEQGFDFRPAIVSSRQADAVQDDETDFGMRRARAEIRAVHPPGGRPPAVLPERRRAAGVRRCLSGHARQSPRPRRSSR